MGSSEDRFGAMRQPPSSDERVRPDGTDEPRRQERLSHIAPALLIAGLVLAALISVQYFDLAEERSQAEAVALSESFIAAHNSRDYTKVRSMVAKAAEISMNPARSVDDLDMAMSWLEATGWTITSHGCTATSGTSEEDPIHVFCSVAHENAWSKAMGEEPDTRGGLALDIVSGEIATALLSPAPMSYANDAVTAFEAWLEETHPDDLAKMYVYEDLPALTVESIELWSRHTNEFVEVERG